MGWMIFSANFGLLRWRITDVRLRVGMVNQRLPLSDAGWFFIAWMHRVECGGLGMGFIPTSLAAMGHMKLPPNHKFSDAFESSLLDANDIDTRWQISYIRAHSVLKGST